LQISLVWLPRSRGTPHVKIPARKSPSSLAEDSAVGYGTRNLAAVFDRFAVAERDF
jgi:hypothetical protein